MQGFSLAQIGFSVKQAHFWSPHIVELSLLTRQALLSANADVSQWYYSA